MRQTRHPRSLIAKRRHKNRPLFVRRFYGYAVFTPEISGRRNRLGRIQRMEGYWRSEDSEGWIISEDRYLATAKGRFM